MAGKSREYDNKGLFFPCVSLISIHQNLRDINLVMDYAGSLSLEKFIRQSRFDEGYFSRAKKILKSVCQAICVFHNNKICHGDIKSENVVLQDKESGF